MRLQPYGAPTSAALVELGICAVHRARHWRGRFKLVYIMISKRRRTISVERKEYILQFRC